MPNNSPNTANAPIIDPLERLKELFYASVTFLLKLFPNATALIFAVILIIIGLLYFFFSIFGLT